jgi:hypothetical protein
MNELPSDCRIPVKRKENLLRENGLPISLALSLALRRQDVHRAAVSSEQRPRAKCESGKRGFSDD